MFIQTEGTPNPATVKFIPGCSVMGGGSANFADVKSAERSPLAVRLFEIEGVGGVFLGGDFITVTKADDKNWNVLKPLVLSAIMEHFTSCKPVVEEGAEDVGSGDDDPIVAKIKEILDTRVRPAVAQDGGDITFHDFADGVVYLHMHGACSGCPSASMTLKHGVENMLRHYIPEVTGVRSVDDM